MPRFYKRRTNNGQWSCEDIVKAKELVKQGFSLRQAAIQTNVPYSTLRPRISDNEVSKPQLGRRPVFTKEVERDLAEHIQYLTNTSYGCSSIQIRKLAFQYAEENNIEHNFDRDSGMAGRDWLIGFHKRNQIYTQKPEATDVTTEVQTFYNLLEELMTKHKFLPKNIYNCDEIEMSTVQDPGKNLVHGENKINDSLTTGRGKNITLLCTMSAAGGYVPPMFIFPRKRMSPQLARNGPTGAIYKCSENGCINENLFLEWLLHFTYYTKPSEEEPVLLIFDNHVGHSSLPVFNHCKFNHIHTLIVPSHSSHKIQPLNITFFGPLKALYRQECDIFLNTGFEKKITSYDVAYLFNKSYSVVANISKGEVGFRAAGIFPLNPYLFSEDLTAAEVLADPVVVEDSSIPEYYVKIDPIPSTSRQIDSPAFEMIDIDKSLIPRVESSASDTIDEQFLVLKDEPLDSESMLESEDQIDASCQIKQHTNNLPSPENGNLIIKNIKKSARIMKKKKEK